MNSADLPGLAACQELDNALSQMLRRFWDLTHAALAALEQDQLETLSGILTQRQICIVQTERLKNELQRVLETSVTYARSEDGPAACDAIESALESLTAIRRETLRQIAAVDQELVRRSLLRKQALLQDPDSPWQGRLNLEHDFAGPKGVLFCRMS